MENQVVLAQVAYTSSSMYPIRTYPSFGEFFDMREDVDFSLAIIEVLGDEPHWPSRMGMQDLERVFSDKRQEEIAYHVQCCIDADLIDGSVVPERAIGVPEPKSYSVYVKGLTHAGNEYSAAAKSSDFWDRAIRMCKEKGYEVTSRRVSLALEWLVARAFD